MVLTIRWCVEQTRGRERAGAQGSRTTPKHPKHVAAVDAWCMHSAGTHSQGLRLSRTGARVLRPSSPPKKKAFPQPTPMQQFDFALGGVARLWVCEKAVLICLAQFCPQCLPLPHPKLRGWLERMLGAHGGLTGTRSLGKQIITLLVSASCLQAPHHPHSPPRKSNHLLGTLKSYIPMPALPRPPEVHQSTISILHSVFKPFIPADHINAPNMQQTR